MFRRRSRSTRAPDPPRWSTGYSGARVLIEHEDPVIRAELAEGLRERGYDPLTCGGPGEQDWCPLLGQEPCPAAAQADVVITGLVRDRSGRRIAHTILDNYPGHRLIVDAPPETLDELDPELRARAVHPLTVERVVAALDGGR
jgi:hypothetical protein